MDYISNPLHGCIVEYPTRYPGLVEVKWAPSSFAPEEVLGIPGVFQTRPDPRTGQVQLFAPWNLWRMGAGAARLEHLEEDPVAATPSGLELKWYQRRGVTFLRSLGQMECGGILSYDPGLGKTVVALQSLHRDNLLGERILIVGPLGAYDTWCSPNGDPKAHYGLDVIHLDSNSASPGRLTEGNIFFAHFDVIKAWSGILFAWRPKVIIIDESHLLMSSESKRTQDVANLTAASYVQRRIALTGTPIPKSRMDLYSQLNLVQPNQWSRSKIPYGTRYAGGHKVLHAEDAAHWVFDGQTNTDELRARLAGVYLRVTKAQVPGMLPNLRREAIELHLSETDRAAYGQAQKDIKRYKEQQEVEQELPSTVVIGGEQIEVPNTDAKKALQLVVTGALKSILDRAKLPTALAKAVELCGKHRRLVVFTWKVNSAEWIYNELSQRALTAQQGGQLAPAIFGPIHGSMRSPTAKAEVARAFASAPWSILVATQGSLGVSINALAAADACLQTMPDWNPDSNLQLESRLHRMGATAEEIVSYYLLARGTLDDRILVLMEEKAREAAELADVDTAGMRLVADLEGGALKDGTLDLNALCRAADEIEALMNQE